MSATPRVEAVKHLSPHPEEAALLGGRLEGWIHGTRSRACPTSARRSPKSATADFGCSLPSFETRASKAPQDEVADVSQPQCRARDRRYRRAAGVGISCGAGERSGAGLSAPPHHFHCRL